jgi:capsular exopolysaccharide synthesis family protein
MSGELVPRPYPVDPERSALTPAAEWAPPAPAAPPAARSAGMKRHIAALRRYKWLMVPTVIVGAIAGVVATRFVKPEYEAQARIWISNEGMSEDATRQGPITSEGIVRNSAWIELLRSYRISDAVVMKRGLFVTPKSEKDAPAFEGFTLDDRFVPGKYVLEVDGKAKTYDLHTSTDQFVEKGTLGDSIGRKVGFRWAPPAAALQGRAEIQFTVVTPREASIALSKRLTATIPENTNFLALSLTDTRPDRAAGILNTWLNEFVTVAEQLKKYKLTEQARILREQMDTAQKALNAQERALQGVRVASITQPTTGVAVMPGQPVLSDPGMGAFYQLREQFNSTKRDREALEQALKSPNPQSILAILNVSNNNSTAASLRNAIARLDSAQVELRSLRQRYTDEYEPVRRTQETVNRLQNQDIPQLAQTYLGQLRRQEAELGRRIAASEAEIRRIPERKMSEDKLAREASVAEKISMDINGRYSTIKLAEATAVSDVQVLDSAVAPFKPTTNSGPTIIIGSILASLALAVIIALLLDRMDRRFRYPEQAVNDLGLTVLGAVPDLRKTIRDQLSDPEEAAQVVEAFRSLRLNIRHAFQSGPITLAISSPGAGEGKSLIASNLALSFAEAGYRTVLVDGDTRRGALHASFGVEQRPGLIDYLAGAATQTEVVMPTTHENLWVVPSGTRRRQGPELLTSAAMEQLVAHLRRDYDVILFDSPPFAAGIDAYALATVARQIVIVLRVGKTDRKLADVKLATLDRLPVQVLGAVMNDVKLEGEYQYYSYLDGYSVHTDQELPRLAAGSEIRSEEEDLVGR